MLLEVIKVVQAEEHSQDKESKLDHGQQVWMTALIVLKHDQALIVLIVFAKDLGDVLSDLVPVVINFFLMLFNILFMVFFIGFCSGFILISI